MELKIGRRAVIGVDARQYAGGVPCGMRAERKKVNFPMMNLDWYGVVRAERRTRPALPGNRRQCHAQAVKADSNQRTNASSLCLAPIRQALGMLSSGYRRFAS